MRKFYFVGAALLLSLSALLLVACDKDPIPEPDPIVSEIVVDSVVEVDVAGGAIIISYEITNPQEGMRLMAECNESWIENLSTQHSGDITFFVKPNTQGEERTAEIELSYGTAKIGVTVHQAGAVSSVDFGFEAEITAQGYHESYITVTPESNDYYFLMDIYLKEDIEANYLQEDEMLFAFQMENYAIIGGWSGMTAEQVAASRARKGVQRDVKLSGLKPDTECVFVAFYYDPERGERLSDIMRYEFTTKAAERVSLGFEFDLDIAGPTVTASVNPDREDAHYYFDVMPRVLVEEVIADLGISKEEYFEDWWRDRVHEDLQGGTVVGVIVDERCSLGSDSYTFDLLADTDYYIFAFGVNDEAVCNSTPQVELFTTGEVATSGLAIEFEVSELTKCGVKVDIIASNSTDPYVAGITTKSEWESFGDNDSERLLAILDAYSFPQYAYGNGEFEEQKALTPDTEYVFFAFGYYGGVVTTKLYSIGFKTLEDIASDVKISIKSLGYYDIYDINAYLPGFGYMEIDDDGYAVMPIEFEVSDDSAELYGYVWTITPDFDLDWVTDSNRFGRMLYWGERPRVMWTIVAYDTEAWVGFMAKDSKGYYTEQYLEKRMITRNGVGDAGVFAEWYNNNPEAKPDISQYIDELYPQQ